jgi:hypothetical protein
MTAHDNLACQWFERVGNQSDVAAMAVLTTADVKAHGADGVTRDLAMFTEYQRTLRAAIPDVHVDIRHCVQGRCNS